MLGKCGKYLEEILDEFVVTFQTTYEHNWESFVKAKMKISKSGDEKGDLDLEDHVEGIA